MAIVFDRRGGGLLLFVRRSGFQLNFSCSYLGCCILFFLTCQHRQIRRTLRIQQAMKTPFPCRYQHMSCKISYSSCRTCAYFDVKNVLWRSTKWQKVQLFCIKLPFGTYMFTLLSSIFATAVKGNKRQKVARYILQIGISTQDYEASSTTDRVVWSNTSSYGIQHHQLSITQQSTSIWK